MENIKLEDMIFLANQIDNAIFENWLRDLKNLVDNTPNDTDLGGKIRKI